jgi:hypothetical protein
MDPLNEQAYEVHVTRCHSCAEQAAKAKAWTDGDGDSGGLFFRTLRTSTD